MKLIVRMRDGSVHKFEDGLLPHIVEEAGTEAACAVIKRELADAAVVLLRIK